MEMQNEKRISEILQKLWADDGQWEAFVLDEEKEGEEEVIEKIRRLLRMLRQELKEGDEEEIREYLGREKLRKETIDKLVEKAKGMLQLYEEFRFLRELERKDDTALKGLLSAAYQKYIVRFEPGYLNHMAAEKYDEEKLLDIVRDMDILTDYYISRSYTRQGMMRDLQDETGLSWENCEYWAELIDGNYQALKMNYIVEELREIRKMVEQ